MSRENERMEIGKRANIIVVTNHQSYTHLLNTEEYGQLNYIMIKIILSYIDYKPLA